MCHEERRHTAAAATAPRQLRATASGSPPAIVRDRRTRYPRRLIIRIGCGRTSETRRAYRRRPVRREISHAYHTTAPLPTRESRPRRLHDRRPNKEFTWNRDGMYAHPTICQTAGPSRGDVGNSRDGRKCRTALINRTIPPSVAAGTDGDANAGR